MATLVAYANQTALADSSVESEASNSWLTGRAGNSLAVVDTSTTMSPGINSIAPDGDCVITESFLSFDTSSIGGTNSVYSAVLAVYVTSRDSGAWAMEARRDDWGSSVGTDDWIPGADWTANDLLATSTSTTTGAYVSFTSTANFPAAVNKIGETRLVICSETIASATQPAAKQAMTFRADAYSGTTSDPKLTIEHQFTGTAIMHGCNF